MSGAPAFFHHVEWPPEDARVRGPVVWIRGWLVGASVHEFHDVRALHGGLVHLGLLGFPRTDLAAHFKSSRAWLPGEFVIGVPLPDGPAEVFLEAQDAFGTWHGVQTLSVKVGSDGEPIPREVGGLEARPGGSWTTRGTHLPFHGHLDDPKPYVMLENGRAEIFGWLLHETLAIKTVWATTDLRIFQQLEHSVTDEALAAKVPALAQAQHARLRGGVDVPPTLDQPACVRIYAELGDGSVHLCLAQRFKAATPVAPPKLSLPTRLGLKAVALPGLSSGRPRRLLMCTLNLQRDDSTLRALDLARHLTSRSEWSARLLTMAGGPLRSAFESIGVSVQLVNPQSFFSATTPATSESALTELGRQIWFKHLDAVAVFDAECLWMVRLARHRQLPVLVDCSNESPLAANLAHPDSADLPNALIFTSAAAVQNQSGLFSGVPASIISQWHSARLPGREGQDSGPPRLMVAPIRGTAVHGAPQLLLAADWLVRRHPEFASRHRLVVADVRDTAEEKRFVQDAVLNQPALMAIESVPLDRAAACICPAFSNLPLRALLDAAAMGLPIVTTESPALREMFAASEVAYFSAGNPLALAHGLVDLAANPIAARRRAGAAQRRVLADHAPGLLMQRWQWALESMVAAER